MPLCAAVCRCVPLCAAVCRCVCLYVPLSGEGMTRRVGGPPPPHAIPVGRAMEQSEERHCGEGRRELAKEEEEDGSTWGEGSGGDEEERHEAATKLQSRQRGRAQRSRYQTKLAAEKLRRRRLPAFVNVYVEGADGKQKVDATPLTRFGGRYDRVDEVDGRRVKGAKVAHYTVRAGSPLRLRRQLSRCAALTDRLLSLSLSVPPCVRACVRVVRAAPRRGCAPVRVHARAVGAVQRVRAGLCRGERVLPPPEKGPRHEGAEAADTPGSWRSSRPAQVALLRSAEEGGAQPRGRLRAACPGFTRRLALGARGSAAPPRSGPSRPRSDPCFHRHTYPANTFGLTSLFCCCSWSVGPGDDRHHGS
eukprot:COSAG02_NODE_1813_length_10785_cov_17.017312_2_plen_362_part_00